MCVCSDLVDNNKHIFQMFAPIYILSENGMLVALLSFQHLVLPVFLILAILVKHSDVLLQF